jgi:large exoprotein involved in heme utilization and adhesion
VSAEEYARPIIDLTQYEAGATIDITQSSKIIGDGTEYNLSLNIAEDVTVVFDEGTGGVKLNAITVADNKTLTLQVKGNVEHIVKEGISIGNGSNVIIEGERDKENNKLTVTATDGNAGIGANNGVTAGDITIRNARVDATGGGSSDGSGAAIGTSDASMGNILIENSIVTAAGGYYNSDDFMEISHAAAIGMGYYGGTMGNITLKDSEITASNNGDGLASVIGAGSQNKEGDNNAGTLGDIIITNTDLNLSMVIGTEICYAAVIGPGMGYSFAWTNMGKIIFTDMTQEQLDAIIPTWLPSDFNEWGAYALGRGYDGCAYKKETFGGVWVSDGNGDTVQIGNENGYYCLNEAKQ